MKPDVASEKCTGAAGLAGSVETYASRSTRIGSLEISRALPIRGKRMVGPWCFLDRFGPHTFAEGKPMAVAPHPHIGLQTVTWILAGETVHKDSLGSEAVLRPGDVNVMTSGFGIAHAEETPRQNSGILDGVQLWVALLDHARNRPAGFQHVQDITAVDSSGGIIRVFSGGDSSATHFSDLIGADLQVFSGQTLVIAIQTHFEHAVLLLSGEAALGEQPLEPRLLYYLAPGRSEVSLKARSGSRVLLIGGPPFPETVLMWWNFVARTNAEIAEARRQWERGERFGEVSKYDGPRLRAPALMKLAEPNPAS